MGELLPKTEPAKRNPYPRMVPAALRDNLTGHHPVSDIPTQLTDLEMKDLYKKVRQQRLHFTKRHICHFQIQDLAEAEVVGNFLSTLFPAPERALIGIMEMLINGIEHGNLGIDAEAKYGLIVNNCWNDELIRRLALPENKDKKLEIKCWADTHAVHIEIKDQGKGFRWQPYLQMHSLDAHLKNGRGIAYANLISFDKMHYNKIGNCVTGSINKPKMGRVESG